MTAAHVRSGDGSDGGEGAERETTASCALDFASALLLLLLVLATTPAKLVIFSSDMNGTALW
jgi:hypothetical protein